MLLTTWNYIVMVFFTCNACGQSIRKNRVEKHWQTECPNCEVLSCMDCGKDFHGEEYAAHTSCITEAEKYQGTLFKGEKGGGSKGDKKQQEWIQNIRELTSSRDYPHRIRSLLDKVSEYPNIPRKKSKFQNFLKNSINVRDVPTLDKLWDVFTEAAQKKKMNNEKEMVPAVAVVDKAVEGVKQSKEGNDTKDVGLDDANCEGLLEKKKRKYRLLDEERKIGTSDEDEIVVKKKKRKIEPVEEIRKPKKHEHKNKQP